MGVYYFLRNQNGGHNNKNLADATYNELNQAFSILVELSNKSPLDKILLATYWCELTVAPAHSKTSDEFNE